MNRRVVYIQCAKREADHPMRGHVDDISDNGKVTSHAFYSVGHDGDDLKNIKVRYRQIGSTFQDSSMRRILRQCILERCNFLGLIVYLVQSFVIR